MAGSTRGVYATPAEFKARIAPQTNTPDTLLEEYLASAARLLDQKLEVVPCYFTPEAGATYTFASRGRRTLRLRDEDGLAYGLRAVAAGGIVPDYDFDGGAGGYTWDLGDPWIWPLARNAGAHGRPYHALQLRRVGGAPITVWPSHDGSVSITGDWGWSAVPGPIRELTIKMARDQADSQRAGGSGRMEALGDDIVFRGDDTWRLWLDVVNEYGRRRGKVARRWGVATVTWTDARAALRTLLRGLGYPLFPIVPMEDPRIDGPFLVLIPPARSEQRRASGVVRTTYQQVIRVMHRHPVLGTDDMERIADAVDAVVEEVSVALRGSLTLGGTAVIVSAPEWDELSPAESPPDSGLFYLVIEGTLLVEVETITTFAP